MSFYKWTQYVGGDEVWSLLLAEQEDALIREKKPAFTTILAADNNFTGEMTREDMQKVRYAGDFYTDFDASSLEEVIPQFQKFLIKLRDEQGFDLSQAKLFASGGKGFHCTIPHACFVAKVNPKGYQFLPAIFKELAMNLVVDTLDLRVYTARRGRMFRTANVERPDKPNVFKVPLTVEEALSITPERYRELCSGVRYVAPPTPPTLNMALSLLHASALDKIEKANKNRKPNKLNAALVEKFKGAVPPSLGAVMRGENLASGIGFQKIATQLALSAHALGLTEEVFLEHCKGLCDNHESDGIRYNTPNKRRYELSRMYAYMYDNPCYEFSIGGVKSLIDRETETPDLDNGGTVLETEEGVESDDEVASSISLGMILRRTGIWKKTEDGLIKVCNVGLSDPSELIDLNTGDRTGYEVTYYVDGVAKGRKILSMDTFMSRQKLMQFTLSAAGASVNATDSQVGALADILKQRANKTNSVVYTITREGVDLIVLPDGRIDTVWADREGVVSQEGESYRLVGAMTTKGAEFRTDLRNAPVLQQTDETEAYFEHLFKVNQPKAMSRMLGWFMACFINQHVRYLRGQFPMLQLHGQAGAGKTTLMKLLGSMHYWRVPVKITSAANSTAFALKSLATSSGSMPFILDEVKAKEMTKPAIDMVRMLLRENYTGNEFNRGRLSHSSGQSVLENSNPRNVAPIAYLGEVLEAQTALMERAVIVELSVAMRRGASESLRVCERERSILSSFGALCAQKALRVQLTELDKVLTDQIFRVSEALGEKAEERARPVYNTAVVLTGLGFGKQVLQTVFGSNFDHVFQEYEESVMEAASISTVEDRIMSEAAKVLNSMAYLSTVTDEEGSQFQLRRGTDYVQAGHHIHLNMRGVYTKYVRYQRSMGQEVLYDNIDAFLAGMRNFAGMVDKVAIDSPLKVTASTVVYIFDIARLGQEGVGQFK